MSDIGLRGWQRPSRLGDGGGTPHDRRRRRLLEDLADLAADALVVMQQTFIA